MTEIAIFMSVTGLGGAALAGWLTLRAPTWAVAMVVASVPLQAFARIGTESGGVTWTQAWLWSFLAASALLIAAGQIAIRVDTISVMFALVVVCYIISGHTVAHQATWWNEVYRWSVAMAFFITARGLLGRASPDGALPLAIALGAVWTGGIAIVQVVTDIGPESFQRAGHLRAYASFGEPNTYGAFAGGCLLVLTALLLFKDPILGVWSGRACTAGCVFALVGLALSQSRGALAATSIVLIALIVVKIDRVARPGWAARVGVAVALTVVGLVGLQRLATEIVDTGRSVEVSPGSWPEQERSAHWGAAVRMVIDSEGQGVGAGQFDHRYRDSTPTWRFRIPQGHAHNAYLQVAAETGIVGLVAYMALIVAVLVSLASRLRHRGSSAVIVAAIAITAGWALHNLVDYLHVLNLPIILVAWWATALGQREGSTARS